MMYSFLIELLLAVTFSWKAASLQNWDDWGHERIQLTDTSIYFRYSQTGKPPLLLVHGSPQHSRTFYKLGPILAENYTVIAPDNRGAGESALSSSDDYTAQGAGADLVAILDFLNITQAYVFSHDKGVGLASSLAFEHPDRVAKLIVSEYGLPGYAYTTTVSSPDPFANWQLAFFAVPDIAQFFVQGREKQMLEWYFWHSSYSGTDVISNDLLQIYTRALSKPGFLRAMFQYFAAVFKDEVYFKAQVAAKGRLKMPMLALGGEAAFSPGSLLQQAWSPIATDLQVDVVPKAGHWIADENPVWLAHRITQFLSNGTHGSSIPAANLTSLETLYTMFGAFGGGQVTAGTNRNTANP